jgi:hypothetical protein
MTTKVSLIADDSVKTGTIFNGTVNSDDLNSTAGSQAVTTDTIRDGAVTSAKLEIDSNGKGKRTVSTSAPTASTPGSNGDIWYVV